jgi:hypothetical protein
LITGIEGHQFSTLVMAIVSRIQMPLEMQFLVAPDTNSYHFLGRVIAELAPSLNVMNTKIFRAPAQSAR